MVTLLALNWRLVLLRGLAALAFGLLTLFYPAVSLAALILLFGAYALVNGVFTIAAAVASRREQARWGGLLLGGVLSVLIGGLTFLMPGVTALALLYLIAAWAIVTGAVEIALAIKLRKVIAGEWLLALAGVLSELFGLALILTPGTGALAVTLWIGAYATVVGIMLTALAFRLRSWGRAHLADGTARVA